MSFPCFVCASSFSTSSARSGHISRVLDQAHQEYLTKTLASLPTKLSRRVTIANAPSPRHAVPLPCPITETYDPDDDDDIPVAQPATAMYVDDDAFLDNEGGITVGDDVNEDAADDARLGQALLDLLKEHNFQSEEDFFNFLPIPGDEVAIGQAGPGPSTLQHLRVLHDEPDARTTIWSPDGDNVVETNPTKHQTWDCLFGASKGTAAADQSYAPFGSRLDWEIAQWAIKEKIHQGSLDRLLKIPEVWMSCFCS